MAWVAPAMMIVGTVMSMKAGMDAASAAKKQGQAQQAAAYNQAAQMDQKAGQERAVAQRRLIAERRREKFVQSSLQARAAAGGGGASDPTVVNIAEDIAEEGDLRARTALYEGEERATGLEYGAKLRRFEGDSAAAGASAQADAMQLQSFGSGLSMAGSMYGKYGGGGAGGGGGVNTSPYYSYEYSPTYGPYGQNGMRPY